MCDVHDPKHDYDYRGDERYHSPPAPPTRRGLIGWMIFGCLCLPLLVVFAGWLVVVAALGSLVNLTVRGFSKLRRKQMELTEEEVAKTLRETREQIALADGPLDEFRAGDAVLVTINGRFLTDRNVKRNLSVGDKLTVVAVEPEHVWLTDEGGLRFKIRRGFFMPLDAEKLG